MVARSAPSEDDWIGMGVIYGACEHPQQHELTDVICAVCQHALTEAGEALRTPCGHHFHISCLKDWWKTQVGHCTFWPRVLPRVHIPLPLADTRQQLSLLPIVQDGHDGPSLRWTSFGPFRRLASPHVGPTEAPKRGVGQHL